MKRSGLPSIVKAICLLLIVTACELPDDRASADDASALPIGVWTEHGFDASAEQALNERIDRSVRDGEVPGGAILIMHRGEIIFHRGFGWGHVRNQTPFDKDARFRAASLTKPVMATLAVALHARGVLDLDKPIDCWLPEARSLRRKTGEPPTAIPTLRQCLSHTAGFRSDYDSRGVRPWLTLSNQGRTLGEVVATEMTIPMTRDPGVKYSYSGIGFDVAGRVVEVATGRAIEEVLQSELWRPLGMTHTTLYPTRSGIAAMPHFYWLHRSDGGFRRQLDRRIVAPGTYTPLGGGMVTTVSDLARFLNLHRDLGGQLIPSIDIESMDDPQPNSPTYGLGFQIGPDVSTQQLVRTTDAGDSHDSASFLGAANLSSESDTVADHQAAWIGHTGSSGTLFWWDRRHDIIGVIATQHRMSDGVKMDENDRIIPATRLSWQRRLRRDWLDPVFEVAAQ